MKQEMLETVSQGRIFIIQYKMWQNIQNPKKKQICNSFALCTLILGFLPLRNYNFTVSPRYDRSQISAPQ